MKAVLAILLLFGAALANHHYDSTTRKWVPTKTPVWKTTYGKPDEGDKSTPNRRYGFTARRWGSTKAPVWKTTYGKPQGGDTTTISYAELSTTRPYQPTRRRVRRQDYTTAGPTAGRIVKSTVKPVKPSPPPSTNDDPFVNELNQYWEKWFNLREGILIDALVYADKHKEQNVAQDISSLFSGENFTDKIDTLFDRYRNASAVLNYWIEYRSASPYLSTLLKTFKSFTPEEQEAFFDRLGRVGPVYHFFEKFRSLENGYSNYELIHVQSALSPITWRKLINSWRSLSADHKSLVKHVMSKAIGEAECQSIWEQMHSNPDMKDFALVTDVMDHRWLGVSCFLRNGMRGELDFGSTIAPYMIDRQKAWSEASRIAALDLVELLKYAADNKGFINETYSVAQISNPANLFAQLDSLLNKYSNFGPMVDVLIETQASNLSQVLLTTQSFFSMSSTEKEGLISELDSYSGYSNYLKNIWFVKSVVPNLKLLKSFNAKVNAEILKKVIRAYADFDGKEKSIVKAVFTDATQEVCKKVLNEKVKIVEMAKALESNGFKSCFKNFGMY